MTYVWLSGSRKAIIQAVMKRIFEFCHERSIQLWIEWIPRKNNVLADAMSKFYDSDDWMLNSKYFRILDKLWGPHTFDRFASANNKQCAKFNSRFWCPWVCWSQCISLRLAGREQLGEPPVCSDRESAPSHEGLQDGGHCHRSLVAQERVVAAATCTQRCQLGAFRCRCAVLECQQAG